MKRGDIQSRTINVMRIILVVYVVIIHSYSGTRGVIDTGQYPVYKATAFFLSLEISQIAVPAFFFISGYLFFFGANTYREKLKNRTRTLVVPYIFWNTLIIAAYLILENIPALTPLFRGEAISYRIPALLREYWDGGSWDNGNGTPIVHQFWYIRNLIILSAISPAIAFCIKKIGWLFPAALMAIWLFSPGQAFSVESATFFSAGACFSIHGKDFMSFFVRMRTASYVIYPVLLVLNTIMRENHYLLPLDRIGFIAGTIFTFNLIGQSIEKGTIRGSAALSGVSFFIFAMHDPMLTFVKRAAIKLSTAPLSDTFVTSLYFLAPAITIGICIVTHILLRRYFPRFTKVITGR